MQDLLRHLQITINDNIYLKNPELTDLGKNIIKGGIELIDEMGLEQFTFKKLALHIGTTESGIYRYFENKHMLLLYLINWYWSWLEYYLVFSTHNLADNEEKLMLALHLLTTPPKTSGNYEHINEITLHRIVTSESYKAYLTKEVDKANMEGYYEGYKRIVTRLSEIIAALNPSFQFPKTLATTVLEGSSLQRYFAWHLPGLTDIRKEDKQIERFFVGMILSMVKQNELSR